MNWKKVGLFAGLSVLVAGITPWLQGISSGHPIPFTAGTVGVPVLQTLVLTLAALFTKPPHQQE